MTDYELTRRDALAALAASGAAVGGALAWGHLEDGGGEEGIAEADRETIVAVAETIYPSAVSGIADFVETYVVGRIADRPAYARGVADAAAELDEYARTFEDDRFAALDAATRDETLRAFGADTADPAPDGAPRERVRYYLINDLQYALYASPTGGELVGIENPQGYPGGTESYRRPPADSRAEDAGDAADGSDDATDAGDETREEQS